MPLIVPDDRLAKIREQVSNPRLNVTLEPREPMRPEDIVASAVMDGGPRLASQVQRPAADVRKSNPYPALGGMDGPGLEYPRQDPSQVQQPEFNTRASNLYKILGVGGALTALLGGDSGIGAAGAGLAAGAAEGQQDIRSSFLSQQEQADAIVREIMKENRDLDRTAAEKAFEFEKTRYLEALRDERRHILQNLQGKHLDERQKQRHVERLAEIEAQSGANFERFKSERLFAAENPTTSEQASMRQAETSREREARLAREGGSSAGVDSARLRRMLSDTERDLAVEESILMDPERFDEGSEEHAEAVKEKREQQRAIERLQAERGRILEELDAQGLLSERQRQEYLQTRFPNLYSRGGLIERSRGQDAATDEDIEAAREMLQSGIWSRDQFEEFMRTHGNPR